MNLKVMLSRLFVPAHLILAICLSIFHMDVSAKSIKKATFEDPGGKWESYLDRIDIMDLTPEMYPGLGSDWQVLKKAHFSFVAELLELYKGEIYFLARDSEYLYDVARLVTQGTPDANRIRLLNISRGNMRDPLILEYLNENGISEHELLNGKDIHLVDTGFAGTIPRVVGERFSELARRRLKTHLIVSDNPQHPSSRVFLSHLNPAINSLNPSSMHGTIVSYEHMPRYTDRSVRFVYAHGRYHAVSDIHGGGDGSVSKQRAIRYMQDLAATWGQPETQDLFKNERLQAARLRKVFEYDNKAAAIEEIRLMSNEAASKNLFESLVRDFIEAQDVAGFSLKLSIGEIGLKSIENKRSNAVPKKEMFIEKFPDWAPILENPDTEIPKLFQQQKWQMIGNLIDANVDAEINLLLAQSLFDAPATGIKHEMQLLLIESGGKEVLEHLVKNVFTQPYSQGMGALVERVILNSSELLLDQLARNLFTKVHSKDMKAQLRLLIEKGKSDVHLTVSGEVFSKFYTEDMMDVMMFLIERGSVGALSNLAQFSFSRMHTEHMVDAMEMILRRADYSTAINMSRAYVFATKQHLNDERLKILYTASEIMKNSDRREYLNWKLGPVGPKAPSLLEADFVDPTPSVIPVKVAVEAKALAPVTATEKPYNMVADPATMPVPISIFLKPNDKIQIGSLVYNVVSYVEEGKRGKVFKVQNAQGAFFALKVAKKLNQDTIDSFAKEKKKELLWKQIQISHSQILHEEKDYLLKTWVEGTRGDVIVKKVQEGDSSAQNAMRSLLDLVARLQAQGVYIGDFRPHNLIWTGIDWVIFDSGHVKVGLTTAISEEKWTAVKDGELKFERRWNHPVPRSNTLCQKFYKFNG